MNRYLAYNTNSDDPDTSKSGEDDGGKGTGGG